MQVVALRDLPYVPTGQFFIPFAFRRNINQHPEGAAAGCNHDQTQDHYDMMPTR